MHGIAGLLEQCLAHQRETIGMHAGRRKPDEHIARLNRRPVHDLRSLHAADGEAGQIVLILVVHAGHLRGLAADERGARLDAAVGHAGDDLFEHRRVVLAAGDVIEEEQRLGSLRHDVVDAHGHAVDADRVMLVHELGDDELRAHTIGAGDEHRFVVAK